MRSPVWAGSRNEAYSCEFGVGHVLLAGGLPIALELPGPERASRELGGRRTALGGRRTSSATSPASRSRSSSTSTPTPTCTASPTSSATCTARWPRVPYGQAVSYRDLALAAGRPNAYRAVGSAMARNALPVILPCHRVIKNDGRLGSYGDDPAWKERLLVLEGVRVVEGRVR